MNHLRAAGNETVAAASMQRDPIVAHCSELMKLGKMLNKDEIKAGKVSQRFPLSFSSNRSTDSLVLRS